jgi:hypothetical protein
MPPYVSIRQERKVKGKKIERESGNDSQKGKCDWERKNGTYLIGCDIL